MIPPSYVPEYVTFPFRATVKILRRLPGHGSRLMSGLVHTQKTHARFIASADPSTEAQLQPSLNSVLCLLPFPSPPIDVAGEVGSARVKMRGAWCVVRGAERV